MVEVTSENDLIKQTGLMSEFSGIKMFLKKGLDGTGNVNVFYTFRCRCGTPRMCPALGSPAVLFPTPNMNLFSRSPTVSEFCPFLLKSTFTIFMPILKIRVMHLQYFHYFGLFFCCKLQTALAKPQPVQRKLFCGSQSHIWTVRDHPHGCEEILCFLQFFSFFLPGL